MDSANSTSESPVIACYQPPSLRGTKQSSSSLMDNGQWIMLPHPSLRGTKQSSLINSKKFIIKHYQLSIVNCQLFKAGLLRKLAKTYWR